MRKVHFNFIAAVIVIAIMTLCLSGIASASDKVIEKQVKQIVFKKDKNGQQYARIIVSDTKTLDGISYKKDTSVMAFGDNVAKVKSLKKGQTFKAVVAENNFRGGTSYQLLELVK